MKDGQGLHRQRWKEGILGSKRGFTKDEKVGILLAELGERREGLVSGGASCWLVKREADILEPSLALALGLLSRDGVTHQPFLGFRSRCERLWGLPALLPPWAFHTWV